MSGRVLVISPHPDDETLGCGGTLLKHKQKGDRIFWLNITGMTPEQGFSPERIRSRRREMEQVAELYGFDRWIDLGLPTTRLDTLLRAEIVQKIGHVIRELEPDTLYLPYPGDVHSDHDAVFQSSISCTKWFRHPSVKEVLVYETLSETEFGLNPDHNGFRPNLFVDITPFLEKKTEIMDTYASETGYFPFPRSPEAIKALAAFRGAAAGCRYAESFMLLKGIR